MDIGGWKSEGTFIVETVTGILIDSEGNSTDWVMNWVVKDNVSGLYFVLYFDCRTGVVVIDVGTVKEFIVQGVWCNVEGLIK